MAAHAKKAKKVAGTKFRADFKPAPGKRKVRFAAGAKVAEASGKIHKEFHGAFRILAR